MIGNNPKGISGIVYALPDPSLTIDAQGRVTAINAPAQRVLGRVLGTKPGPDGAGVPYVTVLRQPDLITAVEAAQRDNTPQSAVYLSRSIHVEIPYQVHIAPFDGGNVLVVFKDQNPKTSLETLYRDFVANVSHELRTPLTAIMGYAETLLGSARNDPQAQARFLDQIQAEAGRMSRLVQDLLSLSRVEADEKRRPTQKVNLLDALNAACHRHRSAAISAGVSLDLLQPDRLPFVFGDHDQLVQVFSNLLENALKYGTTGDIKRITVTAQTNPFDPSLKSPSVEVHIRDFGAGIAAQDIPRLTERFYRVDQHQSRARDGTRGGTGLGLAIVKHILNKHRALLRIESQVGSGAVFRVILPSA